MLPKKENMIRILASTHRQSWAAVMQRKFAQEQGKAMTSVIVSHISRVEDNIMGGVHDRPTFYRRDVVQNLFR